MLYTKKQKLVYSANKFSILIKNDVRQWFQDLPWNVLTELTNEIGHDTMINVTYKNEIGHVKTSDNVDIAVSRNARMRM